MQKLVSVAASESLADDQALLHSYNYNSKGRYTSLIENSWKVDSEKKQHLQK